MTVRRAKMKVMISETHEMVFQRRAAPKQARAIAKKATTSPVNEMDKP
jgi:hypothetical protein